MHCECIWRTDTGKDAEVSQTHQKYVWHIRISSVEKDNNAAQGWLRIYCDEASGMGVSAISLCIWFTTWAEDSKAIYLFGINLVYGNVKEFKLCHFLVNCLIQIKKQTLL